VMSARSPFDGRPRGRTVRRRPPGDVTHLGAALPHRRCQCGSPASSTAVCR
jgi:hypothetical protein